MGLFWLDCAEPEVSIPEDMYLYSAKAPLGAAEDINGSESKPIDCAEGELESWLSRDPILLFEQQDFLDPEERENVRAQVEAEIRDACEFALNSPEPAPETLMEGIFYEGGERR